MSNQTKRIICLLDMDCFYVQCEQRLCPDKWSKPCVVAQYNSWKGGGLIAVNYEAREYGIKRGIRGDEAIKLCPDLHIFSVCEKNGKADLTRYRDASDEVFNAISDFIEQIEKEFNLDSNCIVLEKASVDESYLDFTKFIDMKPLNLPDRRDIESFNTKLEMNGMFIEDWFNNSTDPAKFNEDGIRLLMGAIVVGKLRKHIFEKTQFKCSAGISHNKMLSKLACSTNKPNAQTILPMSGVPAFFDRINISDVRMLGGKLGRHIIQTFGIRTMKELNQVDVAFLTHSIDEKTAKWLHEYSSGIDDDVVINRRVSKSIGCGKNFSGKNALVKLQDVHHWIEILGQELYSRMENDRSHNKRLAKSIIVGYYTAAKGQYSKSINLDIANGYPKQEILTNDIMKSVFTSLDGFEPIVNLSIAATKFIDEYELQLVRSNQIETFFQKVDRAQQNETNNQTLPDSNKTTNSTTLFKLYNSSGQPGNEQINEDYFDNNSSDDHVYEQCEIENLKRSFFFRKLMELYDCDE